ncbi:MAG: SpoIIE family protein phosphatase [Bacteroidales bacterium]|nr:SpoIIE family protein phosphatase [Bacteroidales bacterium]
MKKYTAIILISAFVLLSFNEGLKDNNMPKMPEKEIFFDSNDIGIPFSTFYSNEELVDKNIFSMTQDTLGKYILANRRGIMTFDSKNYNFIKTPGMPYKVSADPFSNRIFIACNNSIGYLENKDTNYVYVEITNKVERFVGDVKIFHTEKNIAFYYKNYIVVVSNEDYSKVNVILPTPGQFFGGIVQKSGVNYVLVKGQGMFEIYNDRLSDTCDYPIEQVMEITFSIELGEKNVFGTSENAIYIASENNFEIIDSEKIEYLHDKIINDVIAIDDKIIAISTLNGGVVFLDIEKQKIVSVLNNYTGLPDNEVFSLYKDESGGLLISNNYGLFRFDLSLPVYNYSSYLGLEGNIISSHLLDTTLYVLTTQGIFYLTKAESDKDFEEVLKQVEKQKSKTNNIQANNGGVSNIENNVEDEIDNSDNNIDDNKKEGTLKKWANKIFGKKDKNKKDKNIDENVVENDTVAVISPQDSISKVEYVEPQINYYYQKPRVKKKQFSELYYIYKKVEGIDSKCKQALEYDNQLIISSNTGLYIIKDNKVENLIKDEYITKISISSVDKSILYAATTDYLYRFDLTSKNSKPEKIISTMEIQDYILSISDNETDIWLGGEGYAYKISKTNKTDLKMYPLSPDFLSVVEIQKLNGNMLFYLPQGMYKYNPGLDSIVRYQEFSNIDANSVYFINKQDDYFWSKLKNELKFNGVNSKVDAAKITLLNLIPNISDIYVDDQSNLWVVSNYSSLFKITGTFDVENYFSDFFNLNFKKIVIGGETYNQKEIVVKYKENLKLKVLLESPYYISNDDVMFQYATSTKNGNMSLWSEKSSQNSFEFPLSVGTYTYYFRSSNVLGQNSGIQIITIEIKPPFWQTDIFKVLISVGIVFIVLIFVFLRQRALKRQNQNLENLVLQRTAEIGKQNEELKSQSEEINRQNEIVKEQRDKIQDSHEYITQSINYARRIQKAILPASEILARNFEENFILSMPKDIVSGDFYWFKEFKNRLYLTVADCTGHGVPGAFLSMMGTAYLNEIVSYKDDITAAEVLDSLRTNVIYSLQERPDNDIRDGMDMSFVIIDKEKGKLQFAGAYNSLFLYREDLLIELKADKMPIGYSRKNDQKFTNHEITYKKNDILYLFSDGFADQFGGAYARKFLIGNFRKLLTATADAPLTIQKELLQEAFNDWKGDNFQVDDITIIGVKI